MAGINFGKPAGQGNNRPDSLAKDPNANQQSAEQVKLNEQQKGSIDSEKPKTAEQAGINVDEIQGDQVNAIPNAFAAEAAGANGINEDTEGTVYSSHPVQNFSVGRFHFNKSTLTLRAAEDVEEFEKLVAGIPAPSRILIKKIDKDAAGRIAAAHFKAAATRGVGDSSAGREALKQLQDKVGIVGVDELNAAMSAGNQFANRGGEDENFGTHPTAAELAGQANAAAVDEEHK